MRFAGMRCATSSERSRAARFMSDLNAPGAFASDMNKAARDHGDVLAKRIPAQRIGTDEDMAGIAIYLASRAGDYVIGNTIAVDGGVVYANAGLEIAG